MLPPDAKDLINELAIAANQWAGDYIPEDAVSVEAAAIMMLVAQLRGVKDGTTTDYMARTAALAVVGIIAVEFAENA